MYSLRRDSDVIYVVKSKVVTASVYVMRKFSKLADLNHTSSDWRTFCGDSQLVTIVLDLDPRSQMVGAFKMASLGVATPSIFGADPNVCAKQSYYASKGLKIAGSSVTAAHNIAHDAQRQVPSHWFMCFSCF